MDWWFEIGAAILGISIVLTLTIDQLLARQRYASTDGGAGAPREQRAPLQFVSRIPMDVFSILGIVLLAVIVLIGLRQLVLRHGPGMSISGATSIVNRAPSTLSAQIPRLTNSTPSARIPKLADSAFSPLPKDFSINRPPWCPACRHRKAPPARQESRSTGICCKSP